ncbi:MAG: FixH family protein [Acetobacteraceae bacterium]|nr:FixH family protein [Acetobacteraceae bacterium]
MTTTMPPDPRRGSWIPYAFVAGMLLVVAVNGVLVYAALSTFTGVTVANAYDRGRGYNQVLAEAARQAALGWRAEVSWAGSGVRVAVTDHDGLPVGGRLDGLLVRPLEGTAWPLALSAAGAGRWAADAAGLSPGQWEARLVLHGPAGERLDIRRRIIVP